MYTAEAAYLAAGGTVEATRAIFRDDSDKKNPKVDSAFCIVRPPGHHAFCGKLAGFCFFNNIPVASRVAQKEFGVQKVCIFDWDVHMGDGSSSIFYEDDSILYISIHRWEQGRFYPSNDTGNADRVGEKAGEGFNINFPVNLEKQSEPISDNDYIYACETVFFPIIREFQPDLIMISAGFDSAHEDQIGQFDVTPLGYAWITHGLRKI